jgi:Lon protease-like protein
MPDGRTALFPLKTVLFPGGLLPLRIFEARYLDMVGRCMKRGQRFGVLMIVDGSEVGRARTAEVGTLAEIIDWHQEADGLLGIVVAGRERFRLLETSLRDDGLYVGTVDVLPEAPRCELPPRHAHLAKLLRQVLTRLGVHRRGDEDYEDAAWVGYRLAEILPLSLEDRQACLEMEDPLARLDKLGASLN